MKRHIGKIVVVVTVLVVIVPTLLYVEFFYGIVQKFRFEQRAERYLAATYEEDMKITKVRYTWDSMVHPLFAVASPKSDPDLSFTLFPDEERESGVSDDYATTLWKTQAIGEGRRLLQSVQPEYARDAAIDFSCCDVSNYDVASIRGKVPHFGTTGLPFDLVIQLSRPIGEGDLNAMYQSVTALRKSDSLELERLTFLYRMSEYGASVYFEIPGGEMNAIASAEDLEKYNASRLPAQDIAERIGASLQWDERQSEATFSRKGTTLVVRSWGNEAILNGQSLHDPIGAYIGDYMKLYVPVRLIERAFGQEVALW